AGAARSSRRLRRGAGRRCSRVGPVRLLVDVVHVVHEAPRAVSVDDLVEGKLARERTVRPDVPAELLVEHLDQALHQQALTRRERAFLSVGRAPGTDEDELDVPVRTPSRLEGRQRLGGLAGAELARGTLPARFDGKEPRIPV